MKNFVKKLLCERKKVVLLHPLNTKGKTGLWKSLAKFFESLRPAQDLRRGSAAREKEPFKRNTKENIKAEPEIQRKTKARQ